jgi:hypothetical protein
MFGERGAAAVEGAIVTPVVLALLFGIIEMGFVFKDSLAVAGAVRSGVRIASASPRVATFAQVAANNVASTGGAMNFNDVQQMWVYKVATTTDKPFGRSDFSGCDVCVKFRWDSGTQAFIPLSDTWPALDQNACSAANGGPPDRIGVHMELRHEPFTGLVLQDAITISEASIMTLEPMTVSGGCGP